MKCACLLLLLGIFPVLAWPAPIDGRAVAGAATVSGVYSILFRMGDVAVPVSSGSTIACRAWVAPVLPVGQHLSAQPITGAGTGAPTGCVVEVPFSWVAGGAMGGAELSFEVRLISGAGVTLKTVTQRGIAVPYPSSAGATRLSFSVGF